MAGPEAQAEGVFVQALEGVLCELQIAVDAAGWEKWLAHYRLLERWNRRMNLTRIREPAAVASRHFGESLFLARALAMESGSVLDVGAGAGFPGLPLAAWRSGVQLTALEAVEKKAVFLREASRGWSNVAVRNERLEDVAGEWDAALMRAVAPVRALPDLARVAGRAAILVGESGAREACESDLFEFDPPVPLPWGKRRMLLLGRRNPSY